MPAKRPTCGSESLQSKKASGASLPRHKPNLREACLPSLYGRARTPEGTAEEDHHSSDQGYQYGSDGWQRFCRTNRLVPSMSRRGNCWDNAVAESFFSGLKKEHIKKKIYKNRAIARGEIAEYIEAFYNPRRRHTHLGGVSPEVFESSGSRH
jgi:putative transposase